MSSQFAKNSTFAYDETQGLTFHAWKQTSLTRREASRQENLINETRECKYEGS
jgi:hypothetical protein